MKFIHRYVNYVKRANQLTKSGWYRNMNKGFTDGHCMRVISKKDLFNMSEYEFERIKRGNNMKNKCPWNKKCANGGDGCYSREPEKCVRFLPLEGTNLTKISGVIETPPEIDSNKFSQYFINWIDSMGWSFAGSFSSENDDYESGSCTIKNIDSKFCPVTINPDFRRGKNMENLRFRCLAKVLSDEDYKVIRDFVGFNFYDESGYVSSKAIKNIYERMPKEELELLFQKYGVLEVMPDDGKYCLADGDPLPKPNVQLMIYCAENNDNVHGGAATLGTDGKWYWTYDMRINKPCEYTVTHWRYL